MPRIGRGFTRRREAAKRGLGAPASCWQCSAKTNTSQQGASAPSPRFATPRVSRATPASVGGGCRSSVAVTGYDVRPLQASLSCNPRPATQPEIRGQRSEISHFELHSSPFALPAPRAGGRANSSFVIPARARRRAGPPSDLRLTADHRPLTSTSSIRHSSFQPPRGWLHRPAMPSRPQRGHLQRAPAGVSPGGHRSVGADCAARTPKRSGISLRETYPGVDREAPSTRTGGTTDLCRALK